MSNQISMYLFISAAGGLCRCCEKVYSCMENGPFIAQFKKQPQNPI
ncbi:MAG: hypothetical protein H6Q66_2531 [Firmicutes bacterium]|nr:hypothetical protein [Bacillota bacterium]